MAGIGKDVSDANLDEAVFGFISNRWDVCFQKDWMLCTLKEADIEVTRIDVAMSMFRVAEKSVI